MRETKVKRLRARVAGSKVVRLPGRRRPKEPQMKTLWTVLIAALVAVSACGGEDSSGSIGWEVAKTDVQPCDLIITEIMAKPSSPVSGRRWIELYNASAEIIDTGRVKIQISKPETKAAVLELRGPGAVLLAPGEFLWVRIDAEALPDEMVADLNVFQTSKSAAIPDNDFEISLLTFTNTVVHSVTFGPKDAVCVPGGGFVNAPAVATDQSMELRASAFSCTAASTECGAWGPAATEAIPGDKGFGTPGVGPTPSGAAMGNLPLPGDLALTEIMYRSGDDTQEADWVEILNLTDDWLNLQGCVIGDGTASGDHTIGDGVVLCPGDLAVLSSKSLEEVGVDVDYVFGSKPNLNQSGDLFYLKCPDESGSLLDIVNLDFSSSAGLFPVPDGDASVQVCPDKLPANATVSDYHNPGAWAQTPDGHTVGSSMDLGTPGAENASCGGEPPQPCEQPCTGNSTCTMLDGAPTCALVPGPGDAMVTEFMVNGSEACVAKKDWVELYNLTGETLVLTGCTLTDDNDSVYTLSGAVAIAPHDYLVLVQDAENCAFDAPNVACFGSNPNLNAGDDSFVIECQGQTVLAFNYGQAGEPDSPTNGDNDNRVAVQLSSGPGNPPSPETAASPDNWCPAQTATACGDLATPGLPNQLCGSGPITDCNPPCSQGFACGSYKGQPVCARSPGFQQVVPTEIMTNGSDACSGGKDWFEILNLTQDYLELKNCALSDDNDSTYTIANSVVLGPGEYLAMVQGAAGCTMEAPSFYCYGGSPNLNTSSDSISLSCGGMTIFDVPYGAAGEIPAPGDNASVQSKAGLGSLDAATLLTPANWQNSCQAMSCGSFGTPGAPNSVCN